MSWFPKVHIINGEKVLGLTDNSEAKTSDAAVLAKLSSDPATQTTLAAVLAKLSSDPATQTTLAAVLAKLSSDPATQTTLAAVLAKLSSDPATQTTLAAILAKIISNPATDTLQTNGNQKTRITDGTNDAAIITGAFTGIKGLRVYGGPTDPISDIPVMVQYDHHQIHEGEMYKYVWQGTLNGATKEFRISVPALTATTRTPHFVFEILGNNTTVNVFLYEGTTFTSGGTDDSALIFNRNRNSLNAAGTKIYVSGATALTVNATGTLLDQNFMFANKPVSNYDRNMAEWDLKPSTEYLVRVVTTGNGTVQTKFHWYEDLGV